MIIEAGYDLHQLIYPYLHRNAKSKRALWVLALDADLRYLHTSRVAQDPEGSVVDAIPQILATLTNDEHPWTPRYFVLAHQVMQLPDVNDISVEHDDDAIRSAPEMKEYHYLGRLIAQGRMAMTTWPRYSFRDYYGYQHLPRAVAIQGPHDDDCACLACSTHAAKLHAAWERNAPRTPTVTGVTST